MERLSSGGRQLVQGVRQLVEQPRPAAGPFYPPPPTTHLPHQPPQPLQGNLPTPTYTQPPASSPGSWQPPQPSPPSPQPPQQLLEDEALAAALQRQFDLEEAQQQQQQQLQRLPPPQQQQQQQPQQPQWPPAAGGPLGAGLPSLPSAGRPSPSAGPQPPRGAAVVAAPPRPPTLAVDSSRCAGCGVSLVSMFGRQPYITALGRCWHPACFRCASCGGPIGGGSGVRFLERQGHAFHAACHKERFHPRCAICGDFVPEQANRRIVWSENRFWKQRYCPSHDTDGTPRCTGCSRLQPAGEQWAELEDGRQLCLECLETASLDTRDAQPLWQSVLSFYSGMELGLPFTPPMMLVDGSALQEAEGRETRGHGRSGGPVFHVRGLTLTQEYRQLRSILRLPGGNPFAVQRETVQMGPTRHEVTAILVLFGLPRLLTGSILAHECCHAYLRMAGYAAHRHLEPQVEEGLCQLMALLWLERQQDALKGPYEERLQSYLAHEIRSDQSEVYGDGLRMALESFQVHGLPVLLAHVRQTGTFPPS